MTFLGTAAVTAGIVFRISRIEWLALVLTVGLVFSAELINTLVEYLCDLFRPKYDLRIKVLKDLASAIPLFASGISLIVAALIFVPKFFR